MRLEHLCEKIPAWRFQSLLFIYLTTFSSGFGQIGGKHTFEFLNVPYSTRATALGGVQATGTYEDINDLFGNAGSVTDTLANHASFNHAFYYGDIHHSAFAMGFEPKGLGLFTVGIQYLNYGTIDAYDDAGTELGEFSANDYAVGVGHVRQLGFFSLGLNMKLVGSRIDSYHATALLFDLGGIYKHPSEQLFVGLSFRNVGFLISDYTETSNGSSPLDIRLGVTYKPKHMPLRLTLTAHNLSRGDITYKDPGSQVVTMDEAPGAFDRIMRHFIVGTEVLINRNFHLRAGYNHMIRKELRLERQAGASGISYGLMFRIKAFELAYSRSHYHIRGAINQIGATVDLNRYFKKIKIN